MLAGSGTAASGHGRGSVMLGISVGVFAIVGRWHFLGGFSGQGCIRSRFLADGLALGW